MTMYAKADSIVEAFQWDGSDIQLIDAGIKYIRIAYSALITDRYSKGVWVELNKGDYLLRSHGTWGKADPKWFEHIYRKVQVAD